MGEWYSLYSGIHDTFPVINRGTQSGVLRARRPFQFAMINAVITKKSGAFQTEEGCLSLDGVRPCTRYKEIEAAWQVFRVDSADYTARVGSRGWNSNIRIG